MKPKKISIAALIIASMYLAFVFITIKVNEARYSSVKSTISSLSFKAPDDTSFSGVFYHPDGFNIDPDLPYYIVRQKQDSIKSVVEALATQTKGGNSEWAGIGYFAVAAIERRNMDSGQKCRIRSVNCRP